MAFDLQKLLRPHIASLKPYSSARDEYTGKEGIFLDANENALGSVSEQPFNRYPDPYQSKLKEKLGAIKQVPPSNIFLGNGSDEAIDLLFRAFCRPGIDNVIIMPPTYGMYEVSAGINDVATKKVSLSPTFDMEVQNVLDAVDGNTKIIFICSPNNPSGNKIDRQAIYQILSKFDGLVVVDEAYIDFSDEPSFSLELSQYANLLVMQTLSKAWGLATLRLGMAFASLEIIGILNKIKPPYNISGLTQDTVLEAIGNTKQLEHMVKEILSQKEKLQLALEAIPEVEKVYPSSANFLLAKVPQANQAYQQLIDKKIIVRDRSKVQRCEDCLRITVGSEAENTQLINALKEVLRNITNKH
ncbi:histidinol-phosphate transaminase [Cyclobacterium qasimii]|uniref:Histidinol-phosphate aminotransferase n=2 Tax=Cyclobacterium qasimii TaxID=1350429 RepID=S7X245_9BACT|nr:histidinol-phosphate transaminase [Cyclobacterium qasimii]EPR70173.1 Histidinol-phosphate aminotransferase [Cyclobacterium qasimii M12-11B]GEO22361.1 histidinol-phosphate aminotransferase [Cyclobacterium qasimii]